MVTLDTADDRTLYFDFLPIQFGDGKGVSVKIKLFTVPGQVMHKSTRKVVLAGADAVAFIADSQRSCASANAYSWRDMEANLRANGIDFDEIPKVVQFNKRDLPDVKPLAEIRKAWGDIPTFPGGGGAGRGRDRDLPRAAAAALPPPRAEAPARPELRHHRGGVPGRRLPQRRQGIRERRRLRLTPGSPRL
jgi:hypothetical protein